MALAPDQRQNPGLGGAKRVVQFLDVGEPEASKGRTQIRFGHRFPSQEELDVGEVFRIGTAHHLGENEVKRRRPEELQVDKGTRDGEPTIEPVGEQEHILLCEQVSQVEAARRQLRVRGIAGSPELLISAKMVQLGERDDRVHVLGRLVPGFVEGESQREGRATIECQLERVVEVTVKGLQDEERVIHGG